MLGTSDASSAPARTDVGDSRTSSFGMTVDTSVMGMQEQGPKTKVGAEIEGRRSPRIDVWERIAGEVGPDSAPVTLLNLSLGGCLMQAPVEYPLGHTLEFRVKAAAKAPIAIRARVVHTMRATAGEVTSYISGLEFLDRNPGLDRALE
jgi:hypothetical protein